LSVFVFGQPRLIDLGGRAFSDRFRRVGGGLTRFFGGWIYRGDRDAGRRFGLRARGGDTPATSGGQDGAAQSDQTDQASNQEQTAASALAWSGR
jgi:hypothetical protein